jgi:hypothetical protein
LTISGFYKGVSYLLIFLVLFLPFTLTAVKMACVAMLLISGLFNLLLNNERIRISKSVIIWLSLFTLHGLFFLAVGMFYGAQLSNVLKFSTIAVVWPLVFTVFFFYKADEEYIKNLYKVIQVAVVFIAIYAMYRVASLLGLLPAFDFYSSEASVGLMISEGNVELSIPATTSLVFAVPSIVSLYVLTRNRKLLPVIIIALVAIVLISRRALLLSVAISPLICLAVSVFFLKKRAFISLIRHIFFIYFAGLLFCVVAFTILAQLGIFDFGEFFKMILEGFDFSGSNSVDPGAQIRAEQFTLLMRSWAEKPLFGWGYGAVSQYIIRSDLTPFIYELSYIALLFQTGIFGFLTYMSLIAWIYYKFSKLSKHVSPAINNYSIAILVGLTTFLLSNATNPYLYAFDHMWALFYPLLVINTLILKKEKIAN